MLGIRPWSLLMVAAAVSGCFGGQPPEPKFDKQHFEDYVRYAEGYTPSVKIDAENPTASAFPGIQRVVAHVSLGEQKIERIYYRMPDGQSYVAGNIWNLKQSPFLDVLARIPTDGPAFGPANAKITVVVFSDFQCPYCRQLASTLRDNIPKKNPDNVRVVFEDFPLDAIHKWARAAAEGAHCLGDGNPEAFWAFHDWIFEHQGDVTEANVHDKILEFAKTKSLDVAKIGSCMASHATASEVEKNQSAGQALQVQQTPTLFVNGRMLSGAVPWTTLDAVFKLELNRPKEMGSTYPVATK
jgi:protein-disulfide isomerase